jgi:translation initiation factor IF-2
MSKRLSKIARELNIGISTIAEFLNSNGYECEENPNEKIQEEVFDFLKNNISGYVADRQKSYNVSKSPTKQPKKTETQATEQVPEGTRNY